MQPAEFKGKAVGLATAAASYWFTSPLFERTQFLIPAGISIAAGAVLGAGTYSLLDWDENERGGELISFREAKKRSKKLLKKHGKEGALYFGGLWHPSKTANEHWAVIGASGSGKTVTIRLLMQSFLPTIRPASDERAIIFDSAKHTTLPTLAGMNLGCKVVVMNPIDKRSYAWDMAADITSPADAMQISKVLIPDEGNNPFFPKGSRDLLCGVLKVMMLTRPRKWEFRDVCLSLQSPRILREVLGRTPYTKPLIAKYFGEPKTLQNLLATMATGMAAYEIIASCWHRAAKEGRTMSLKKFMKSSQILVLGTHEPMREATDALNRLIFKRFSELALQKRHKRTWVVIDEAREAGELPGLSTLLTNGREQNVCCVLGFQDIAGMQAVYTDLVAAELIGQCDHKVILKLSNPETMEWAARLFGKQERTVYRENQGSNGERSYQEQVESRDILLSSEFRAIKRTSQENGLTGCYIDPNIGDYQVCLPAKLWLDLLWPPDEKVSGFRERKSSEQYLEPWSEDERQALGLGTEEEKKPEEPTPTTEPVEPAKPESRKEAKPLKPLKLVTRRVSNG